MPGPLASVPTESWNRVIAVKLIGTAAVVRAASPELERSRGRVVIVASTLAHCAVSDATAYCASKFGVVGFTRALGLGDFLTSVPALRALRKRFSNGHLVLFGPSAPSEWGPPKNGRHVALWSGRRGDAHAATVAPGLIEISVAQVWNAILALQEIWVNPPLSRLVDKA